MSAPFTPSNEQRAPDITLTGETVAQLFAHLNNAVIFAKSPDGSMRPFVDPLPIQQILSGALQAAMRPRDASAA